MENLINDLIHRLEHIKDEEKIRIHQCQKLDDEDSIRILSGKIMAIDYCINELRRLITYAHQSVSNH
jgi:hypothetical protein